MKLQLFIILLLSISFAYADFSLNPSSNDFGFADQGSALSQVLSVQNTGTGTIEINLESETLSGPNNYSVSFINSQNKTLDAGESRDYTLAANLPAKMWAGAYAGSIIVSDNESNSQAFDYTLEINPVSDFDVESPLVFGDVYVNQTKSITFDIKNTGNTVLTSIRPIVLNANYGLSLSQTTIDSINPGESASVTATVSIPYSVNVQNDIPIGSLRVDSDQLSKTFGDFKINIKTYLRIDKARVTVADKSANYKDGETIDEKAKPRDTVQFDIDVENIYDTSAAGNKEIELDNVDVKVTIFDIDDGDDIELESDTVGLDYSGNDKKHTITLQFDVPSKAQDSSYDVEIRASGEDEDNNDMEDVVNLILEVERDSHDLVIDGFDINPSVISCGQNPIIGLKFTNLGKNDEDYVRYTIQNAALGLDLTKSRFTINSDFEDDNNIYQEDVKLNLNNPKQGTYPIELRLYRDFDILEDILSKNLVISSCESQQQQVQQEKQQTEPQVEKQEEQTVSSNQEEQTQNPVQQPQKETTQETVSMLPRIIPNVNISNSGTLIGIPQLPSNFRESKSYTYLLLLAYLFIILVLLMFLLILKKK